MRACRTLRRSFVLALVTASVCAASALAGQSAMSEGDAVPLVTATRIATLEPHARAAWSAYLAQSRADRLRDSNVVVAELKSIGRPTWVQPKIAPDFRIASTWDARWFATDSARSIAATMLSFQTPSGGWTKHADMFGAPRPKGTSFFSETAGWDYIATIDNSATTTQLLFLTRLIAAQPKAPEAAAWRASVDRGIDYLLRAQYPSGGWPQVYPLQGGYHDATTYNDDATVNVLRVLRDVRDGRTPVTNPTQRARAAEAFTRGVDALLADQVPLDGQRTVWGQQHDPITRLPVKARSYELAGLTGGESAGILSLLMSIDKPTRRMVEAVHDGARWLETHRLNAMRYDSIAGTYITDANASPLWARIYEIPSLKPVMANRDGVPRYDFAELTDRRTGYAWYVNRPASMLIEYAEWSRHHPSPSR